MRKFSDYFYSVVVLAVFCSLTVAFAEELPVPGGKVGEWWGVELKSVYGTESSISLDSGPAWATLDSEGVLSGTPTQPGEARWEITVEGGEDPGSHSVSAEFFN